MSEKDSREEVIIYGSTWCGWTQRAFKRMKGLGIEYRYVDVDADPEAEQKIAAWNNGRAIRPTYQIGDDIMVHPDDETLLTTLRAHGKIPSH